MNFVYFVVRGVLMSEAVCLQCGKEIQYDWAACPHCGWKAPENWEEPDEEGEMSAPQGVLSKPRPWIAVTAWVVLAAALAGLVLYLSNR